MLSEERAGASARDRGFKVVEFEKSLGVPEERAGASGRGGEVEVAGFEKPQGIPVAEVPGES
jgi:hypothetical protein